MAHPEVRLKIRVQGRHPWFFRKMVEKPKRTLGAGSTVRVVDRNGRFVGTAFYNSRTDLAVRMLARAEVDDVDQFLVERLDEAIDLRERFLRLPSVTTGYRLVHSEGDGFPGLVLDRLGDTIVAQVFSLGVQKHLEPIGERLLARYPGSRLVLTVDEEAARREGMTRPRPPAARETEVVEHGMRFAVTPGTGHKTGFFADQREHRQRVRRRAKGRRVLDLCCNSGAFATAAGLGGARQIVAVDLDEEVLELARHNLEANDVRARCEHADAFDYLRGVRAGSFDLIILDPPKWAAGKTEIAQALRRYEDLNRLAFEALEPGGLLLTCSCSGAVSEQNFLGAVRDAAAAAGRDARLLHIGGAGPDHPVALECPQTRYLKVALLQVR